MRIALQLAPHIFVRPGELRMAEWSAFDLAARLWEIPAAKTKMRHPHKVYLTDEVLALLKKLRTMSGDGCYLFPSVRTPKRPITDNTLNAALRRLGYTSEEMTAHGFRATASTLLNESRKWHPDAIERQLAHVDGNKIRRAYARGEHWGERVKMMQYWSRYLAGLKKKSAAAG